MSKLGYIFIGFIVTVCAVGAVMAILYLAELVITIQGGIYYFLAIIFLIAWVFITKYLWSNY